MLGHAINLDTGCVVDTSHAFGPQDSARAQVIERQIEHRAGGRIYDLRVNCTGDRVVLQGRCRTYHAKQLAQEAALDLAESPARVENQIVVG
ncbi:phospholipid-binding protein [Singulisphaera sp. Ch08]|uniref:Phospholipid-binding protein n=1 Tax=Singulisphaera sp. Ch08 TaxID=3120278 RepID=A0AAU7CQJ4_9BACT